MSVIFSMRRPLVELAAAPVVRPSAPLVIVQDVSGALRAVESKGRRFSGIAAKGAAWNPGSEDSMGDILEVVGLDTSRWKQGGSPLLKDHKHDQQIGHVTRDRIVGDEWRIEAELYPPGTTAAADEAWAEIQAGGRSGLSVGFQPLEFAPRTTARGGQGIHYTKMLLLELSSVNLPACPACLVTQRCATPAPVPRWAHGLTLEIVDDRDLVLELADGPSRHRPLDYRRWER